MLSLARALELFAVCATGSQAGVVVCLVCSSSKLVSGHGIVGSLRWGLILRAHSIQISKFVDIEAEKDCQPHPQSS